ncbi:MAG: twin-arginine translocation signal domain-containing protein [Phycisphaera sp.]|nr:twin-arginine translocation signal domain-containing protein [Phycisphaera sp.]
MTDHTKPSRRDFVKQSGALAVSAAAMSQFAAHTYAASNDKLKLGLVGCGGRGSGACGQALEADSNIELYAMGDIFPERLETSYRNLEKSGKTNVPDERKHIGFDAYMKVIDSVDVVILTTPPGFRPLHFEYAVNAGKNIFMEKPVATDPHGIRRVLAAAQIAKDKNLKVGVGLQRHHDIRYIETIKRIQDGLIGDITSLRCYWNGSTPWTRNRKPDMTEMEYQLYNWYYFTWMCGDHIVEQHIHNIDVCNWVMGHYDWTHGDETTGAHPTLAQGMGGCQVRNGKDTGQTFDHHFVEFCYTDKWDPGVHSYSQARHIPDCYNTVSEHAQGTKGYSLLSGAVIYDEKGEVAWKYDGRDAQGNRLPRTNPYQVEHDDLFHAIRNNLPYNEVERGATATMSAIFGRMATYSGQMVRWDDALNAEVDYFPHDVAQKDWSFNTPAPVQPIGPDQYQRPLPGITKVINDKR